MSDRDVHALMSAVLAQDAEAEDDFMAIRRCDLRALLDEITRWIDNSHGAGLI